MKNVAGRACALAVLLVVQGMGEAGAQTVAARGSVALPLTGTFAQGGTFTGTMAVTRFEARGNQIFAMGFISGKLTRGNRTLGTALVGEVAVPVTVRSGGIAVATGRAAAQHGLTRVAFATDGRAGGLRFAQAATCPVADVVLGPFTVDILGAEVFIPPVEVHLTGEEGTPLGDLLCEVSELIGNVAGLVGVLNNILNLLILLLGGLTGGLGAIPGV